MVRATDVNAILTNKKVLKKPFYIRRDLPKDSRTRQAVQLVSKGANRESIRISRNSIILNTVLWIKTTARDL